jgi:hypothetical protein
MGMQPNLSSAMFYRLCLEVMGFIPAVSAGILREQRHLEQGTCPMGYALVHSHGQPAIAVAYTVIAIGTSNLESIL